MKMNLPPQLISKLKERKEQQSLRKLRLPQQGLIDFCSNDYLGIVKNNLLFPAEPTAKEHHFKTGSTGSRLLTGNYPLIENTEQQIADFHEAEAALLFNSGYDANLGVLSCLPQKGDTILYDSLCHASIRDGIRLSFAQAFSFLHNDVEDLEKKLQRAVRTVFIVTESVFSMDGDSCPLSDIIYLCSQYNAYLILDEAHAIGVIGEQGEGVSQSLGLHQDVFCRIYTFGKACGCHGAVVAGSNQLKEYLVNFARSFIYSTALPEHTVSFIQRSYEVFPSLKEERKHLHTLIEKYKEEFEEMNRSSLTTPIQTLLVPGNEEAKQKATELQQKGFDVKAILSPAVPKGTERLRIILHAFNTIAELNLLTEAIKQK